MNIPGRIFKNIPGLAASRIVPASPSRVSCLAVTDLLPAFTAPLLRLHRSPASWNRSMVGIM